jgi:hypothetical protein
LLVDKTEFAIINVHCARQTLREEAAMEARLTAHADGATLRAFEQTRGMTGREPLRMRCTGRAFVWIQQPLDMILDKAVPEDEPE